MKKKNYIKGENLFILNVVYLLLLKEQDKI